MKAVEEIMQIVEQLVNMTDDEVASEVNCVEKLLEAALSEAYWKGYDDGQFERYADLRHDMEGEQWA